MIEIKKPVIIRGTNDLEGYTRLCSEIVMDGNAQTIWYEVENEYAQYLCHERADAFFIGILPLAMAFKHDIKITGCTLSERIYWQAKNMLIPALAKFSGYYSSIEIEAALDSTEYPSYAVGTGFSAGVDSFFTVLKNVRQNTNSYNITHLTFFNVGANGSYGGKKAEERFQKRIALYQNYIEQLGVGFVKVNSNISEFIMMSYNFTHSFRSMSAVLALQKLFKTYYYSSGLSLDEFSINAYDSAFYDLLNVQCFSSESTQFYSTGLAESRIEKLEYISQFPETYSLLNVCNEHDVNCRTCEKCVRTMGGLYAIGALEKYSDVFDVPYFYKHLTRNMAFILAKPKDNTSEARCFGEIVEKIHKNKKKIPFFAHLKAIPLMIKFKAIAIARKNKKLRAKWHAHINKTSGIRFADVPKQ